MCQHSDLRLTDSVQGEDDQVFAGILFRSSPRSPESSNFQRMSVSCLSTVDHNFYESSEFTDVVCYIFCTKIIGKNTAFHVKLAKVEDVEIGLVSTVLFAASTNVLRW